MIFPFFILFSPFCKPSEEQDQRIPQKTWPVTSRVSVTETSMWHTPEKSSEKPAGANWFSLKGTLHKRASWKCKATPRGVHEGWSRSQKPRESCKTEEKWGTLALSGSCWLEMPSIRLQLRPPRRPLSPLPRLPPPPAQPGMSRRQCGKPGKRETAWENSEGNTS